MGDFGSWWKAPAMRRENLEDGDSSDPARPNAKETEAPEQLDLANRLALRPAEAATALGLGERTLRDLLPRIPHLRTEEGGAILIPVRALEKWLEEQVQAEGSRAYRVAGEILSAMRGDSNKS